MSRLPARFVGVLASSALLWIQPLGASDGDGSVAEDARATYLIGGRLGFEGVLSGPDAFNRLWGDTFGLSGLDLEIRFRRALVLASIGWTTSLDGRLEAEVPRTFDLGVDTVELDSRLSTSLSHLSWGWSFPSASRWTPVIGGGLSALDWEDRNDLRSLRDTDFGPHLLAGAARELGRWSMSGVVRYTWVRGFELDVSGTLTEFEEADLGLLGLELAARYRVWPPPARSGRASSSRRGPLEAYILSAWLHPTYRHTRLAAEWTLASRQDDGAGFGVGLGVRLGGPLTLALEGIVSELDTSSTQTLVVDGREVVLHASGRLDVEALTLALEIDLLRRQRLRLFAAPLLAYLSYEGSESGDYEILIDRDGSNFGLEVGAELPLGTGSWSAQASLEHLSVVRIDGFESGFEIDPLVLTLGIARRFGGRP